tara:strand:+ start:13 stop:201 length:189 start_codon:yes stop_codon:yes gene_type:complete
MNVKLTANSTGRKIIVNWDNVNFTKEAQSAYGDSYVEVNFGHQYIDVKESLEEIENLTNTQT